VVNKLKIRGKMKTQKDINDEARNILNRLAASHYSNTETVSVISCALAMKGLECGIDLQDFKGIQDLLLKYYEIFLEKIE